MIKVDKDLLTIPDSLIPALLDLFPGKIQVPLTSRTTHEKRMLVINGGSYNDSSAFNDRYKLEDVRQALTVIYRSKCAFCEQKVEQYNVEHYRPKVKYYWLAFSWDNLIMACPFCNQYKGTNFDLINVAVVFHNNVENIRRINESSANYDAIEQPRMVNPEVTNPEGIIRFDMDGRIESDDDRFTYTIETCKLNRAYLKDYRRTLLNTFREYVRAALIEHADIHNQKIALETIVRNFLIDSKNLHLEFLAFRRYAITENWLNQIIKELN